MRRYTEERGGIQSLTEARLQGEGRDGLCRAQRGSGVCEAQ